MPAMISDLVVWRARPYLRGHKKVVVPRFPAYFMKNSVCHSTEELYCGTVFQNILMILVRTFNNFIKRQNLV